MSPLYSKGPISRSLKCLSLLLKVERKDQKNHSVRSNLLLQSGRVMKGRAFLDWSGHCHATRHTRAQRTFGALTFSTQRGVQLRLAHILFLLLQEIIILPHLLVDKKLEVVQSSRLSSLFTLAVLPYLLLKKFRCMESLTPLETGAEHFVFFIVGLSLV